jgi:tetratricopeptide (TPR) repeat protein
MLPTLRSALACAALLAALAPPALAQTKPISREGLVKAVRINGLSTAELVQQIRMRGVAFQMTPDAEAELRGAGARPEVVEAARSNYRPGAAPAANTANNNGPRPGPAAPKGPVLSKTDILNMLQAGAPSERVEQMVDARGVNFQVNPSVSREITAAGGTKTLLGAIASNYVAPGRARLPAPTTPIASPPPPRRDPDYDDLTDQATAAYDARNPARATQLLQQAIAMDPRQPRAYQLLGFTQLYLQSNISEAEQNMRRAIELGGSASFRVFHDHANGTFNQTCAGTLFVTKTDVTFKADDGRDTFEAADALIKEIKTNKLSGGAFGVLLGGKDLGAFHITVRFGGKDSKNYNFAPLTKKRAESELIISLVRAYGGVQS